MVEITNVAEMKDAFHRFISSPDRAKERIRELQDRSNRNFSSRSAKRKKDGGGRETEQNIQKLQDDFKRYNTGVLKYQRRESLKEAWGDRNLNYRGERISSYSDILSEMMQARRE